jgi:hypothetical protein
LARAWHLDSECSEPVTAIAARRINFDVLRIDEKTLSEADHEEPSAQQLKLSVLPVKDIPNSDTTM